MTEVIYPPIVHSWHVDSRGHWSVFLLKIWPGMLHSMLHDCRWPLDGWLGPSHSDYTPIWYSFRRGGSSGFHWWPCSQNYEGLEPSSSARKSGICHYYFSVIWKGFPIVEAELEIHQAKEFSSLKERPLFWMCLGSEPSISVEKVGEQIFASCLP